VVGTNELHHLRDCLPSLALLDGPPTEVIVVDNASNDGTGPALAAEFPWVRVVRSERRLGFAPANNLGFRHARGAYLVVLNPDTRVDPRFVCALIETSRGHGDRALVTSRVSLYDDPDTINACGNVVQFGLSGACRGLGQPADLFTTESIVASVSGCAFLIPRPVLEAIKPFAETIFPYLEDTELSLRAWVAGFRCVVAPESRVYHKYGLRLTPRKFFFIERNRWLVMLRVYRLRTFLLLLPALLAMEGMSWGYATLLGKPYVLAKARSYGAIGLMLGSVRAGRQEMRSLRRIDDRVLLARLDAALPVNQLVEEMSVPPRAIRLINAALERYFGLVRRVVRW
jgi:GT2 family glycosyltransferase